MPLIQNYVHFVWVTWNRRLTIEARWESDLYAELRAESERLGCIVLALGGIENHVHRFVSMPATCSLSEAMKQVKGSSALFVNARLAPLEHFKWQHEYAAFSVSRWDKSKIAAYINNQKEHHANGTIKSQLELPPPQRCEFMKISR